MGSPAGAGWAGALPRGCYDPAISPSGGLLAVA